MAAGFARALAACALLAALACQGGRGGGVSNLVLVSIDGLRADRLGAYGYERDTTPRLDAFAARGAVFERVVAESSWTIPSQLTLLTGLYPATHAVASPRLAPGAATRSLAQRLRDAGFHTIGLTESAHVGKRHGFDRGFTVFNDVRKGLPRLLGQARSYLSERPSGRFFLFVHTLDLRCPYAADAPYGGSFASPGAEPIDATGRCGAEDFDTSQVSPAQARYLSDRYDEAVLQLDDRLGEFLEWLEAQGLLSDTLVVITSDHGEELLDHGRIGHGRSLYREVLMVPLLIVGPGVSARRIPEPVGLVDVAPTALALLGLAVPPELEGTALLPQLAGERIADGARMSELAWPRRLESVMTSDFHWIHDPEAERAQLFDLRSDPGETRDLAASDSERVAQLRAELDRFRSARQPRPTESRDRLQYDLGEGLRQLGEGEAPD